MGNMSARIPRCLTALLLCALGLLGSRVAFATPIRVEVQPLLNTSELAATDVEVLDSLLRSELSKLAQESFEVVPAPAASGSCDAECSVSESAARGAGRLVTGSVTAFGGGFVGALELYDVSSGQLLATATTGVVADSGALLDGVRKAAAEIRGEMEPRPISAEPVPAAPNSKNAEPATAVPTSSEATLRVETIPPKASVFLKRVGHTEFIGLAPMEKVLLPVEYRVIVRLAAHRPVSKDIRLDPHERETLRFKLDRIYPMSPYKRLGHAVFWPGLVGVGLGFVFMANAKEEARRFSDSLSATAEKESRKWVGAMWASFGAGSAFMITGIVVWAVSPSSKEHWEKKHGAVGLAPLQDGFALAYGRRF